MNPTDRPENDAPNPLDELADRCARSVELAQRLHRLAADHPDFELLDEPRLSLDGCRFRPHALAGGRGAEAGAEDYLDRLNERIAGLVQKSGLARVTTTRVRGHVALQFQVDARLASEQALDLAFDAVARIGRAVHRAALAEVARAGRAA